MHHNVADYCNIYFDLIQYADSVSSVNYNINMENQ